MLVPAILYKEQIIKEFQKLYYTEDMLFENGNLSQWYPNLKDAPEEGRFDYAIVSGDKLIGYLSYQIDYYVSRAYNFGLMSFDRGNPSIGYNLFEKMEELISKMHKVEWCCVSGNPVEKHYDNFCEKHHGIKHVLKDSLKDHDGNYRDCIIYEIFNNDK